MCLVGFGVCKRHHENQRLAIKKKGKYSKIKFLHKLNAQTDSCLLVCLKFDHRFRFPNCKGKTDGSHLVKGQLEDLKLLGLDSGARTSSLCPPWTVLPLVTLGRVVLRVPVDRTWAFSTIRSDEKVSAGNNGGIWQQPELLLQAKRGQLGVNFKCCSIEG